MGVGFIRNDSALQALYIRPDFGRCGIGSRIVAAVEKAALPRGLSHLTANAALNAAAFHPKNGFEVLGPSTLQLSPG